MRALTKKLLRDLWVMRWQYAAVATMVVLGVSFYVAATMVYQNLDASYQATYAALDFEDVGVTMQPAPARIVERIRRIPGVVAVEGRIVQDVLVELPSKKNRKLIGRLVSLPKVGAPSVNALQLEAGEVRVQGRSVLLEKSFAVANDLHPGDSLTLVEGPTRISLRIAGLVVSPEYVFVVRSKQDLMPSPETFGVMFLSEDTLGPLVGKPGQIDEVRARMAKDADVARVGKEMERILAPYNPDPFVPRADQPSYQLIQQDIEGFKVYAVLFPLLFLSVSSVTVYTLLARTVHQQRGVIGLLRAIGYSRGQVVLHYLISAAVIGIVSGAVGVGVGLWLGVVTTDWYLSFVTIARIVHGPAYSAAAYGILLAVGVCVVAGAAPARLAARIVPSESMRGERAKTERTIMIDRLFPHLSLLWRIPLRNIFRQTKRTVATVFGIVAAICLIMTARGLLDSMDEIMRLIVGTLIGRDVRAEFLSPQDADVVHLVRQMKGVSFAQGTLSVPVEFVKDGVSYSSLVTGLDNEGLDSGVVTRDGRPMRTDGAGFVIGRTISKRLGLEVGDTVIVRLAKQETTEKPQPKFVRVTGIHQDAIGTVAYTTRQQVWRLFHGELTLPNDAVSGLRVSVTNGHEQDVRRRLEALPEVAAVSSPTDVQEMIDEMVGQFRRFVTVMLAFGSALAFCIVFNTVTINVLERTTEVATMRTIGVLKSQIAWMVTIENAVLGLIGIVIGLPVGRWFVGAFMRAAQTEEQSELFTFGVTVYPVTYAATVAMVFLVLLVSQIPSLRYLSRLDLAKATKEQAT